MNQMFERLAASENLRLSYDSLWTRYHPSNGQPKRFRAGPDGETLDQFASEYEHNLAEIQENLKKERFSFGPYWERPIPKGNGEQRLIGQFNLRDRIVFRAMHQVIAPSFDENFSESLVSYRKGLGAWDSVRKAMRIVKKGGRLWVFRTDIRKYAESFDIGLLREQIEQSFRHEGGVVRLFLSFLRQERIVDGIRQPRPKGCPQGSELTTFFYNFYLKDLDKLMLEEGFRYSRYSDDIIVWAESEEEGMLARRRIEEVVKKMKLELHPEKTFLAAPNQEYDYLGYKFRGLNFTISDKSLRHLTNWVRRTIRNDRYRERELRRLDKSAVLRLAIEDFQSEANVQKVISWLRYFQRITDVSQIRATDRLIRERLLASSTGRFSRSNYKLVTKHSLGSMGLRSLTGLHYRMSRGRPLPADIENKLSESALFSPEV